MNLPFVSFLYFKNKNLKNSWWTHLVEMLDYSILTLLLISGVLMNWKQCTPVLELWALFLSWEMLSCHLNLTISFISWKKKIYLSQLSNFRQECWLEINTLGNTWRIGVPDWHLIAAGSRKMKMSLRNLFFISPTDLSHISRNGTICWFSFLTEPERCFNDSLLVSSWYSQNISPISQFCLRCSQNCCSVFWEMEKLLWLNNKEIMLGDKCL